VFFSLREFLWVKFYGDSLPPSGLVSKEVIVSFIVALFILLCWWVVRKAFFLIAQRAISARVTSIIFCIGLAFAWLLGSLEFAGFQSFSYMIILMFLTVVASMGYLIWVRNR